LGSGVSVCGVGEVRLCAGVFFDVHFVAIGDQGADATGRKGYTSLFIAYFTGDANTK